MVVVAIIAILAALLLPGLRGARDKAKQVSCASQLHQIGILISVYAGESAGQVPQGFGAIAANPALANNPYAKQLDPTGTHFMYYQAAPLGLGLLSAGKYIQDGHLFYCPALSPKAFGGYQFPTFGWNTNGGPSRTEKTFTCSSYFYRYVERIEFGSDQTVDIFDGRIETLVSGNYAAAWDSYWTKAGMLNPGYHRSGYNVLFYDGSVRFMVASKWIGFPYNQNGSFDPTDDKDPNSTHFFCIEADKLQ